MPDKRAKVDIGFTGGQVLALRVDTEVFNELRKAVEGDKRFYELDAGDSAVTLDLSQVVYLRVETEDHRVGFDTSAIVARFSSLGEHGLIWFGIAAAARRWDAARTVAIAYGANQLVKVIVRRRRPPRDGRLTSTQSDLSYPSAHAATSVAGAWRLSETLPAAPLWLLAAALAGSRVHLRVHYPTDTIAGAALGGAVAELTR